MTPDRALSRIRALMALAAKGSGAAESEARNAALTAVQMMQAHGLVPVSSTGSPASPIDLDQVADLALQALDLEHRLVEAQTALAAERTGHVRAMKARDAQWRAVVDRVRQEVHRTAEAEHATVARTAVRADREALASKGGRARSARLTSAEKSEIGKKGARERWRRWRAERGLPPR